jgi:2-polyprenyl-3-methyl-5-hydroxy-6-metoxy-1,4-benzoquinol methylase
MANTFDERFELTASANGHIIYDEHVIRYELACTLIKDKSVLEIASGSGYGSNMLASSGAKKVLAMDIDAQAIERAKGKYRKENLEFRQGNAEKIDLPDSSVDMIISFETIEHLEHPEKFLSSAKRILKSGGIALVSTPNWEVSQNKNPFHVKEYTEKEFTDLLKKYFQNIKILKQRNAMASVIGDDQNETEVLKNINTPAQFFVAICSDAEVDGLVDKNFVSLNGLALENIYNNPGLRLVNMIYSVVVRVPGVKRILKKIGN